MTFKSAFSKTTAFKPFIFKPYLLLCLFLSACNPNHSDAKNTINTQENTTNSTADKATRQATNHQTYQANNPDLSKQEVAKKYGYCHMFSQPRTFFRFLHQPTNPTMRFSIMGEGNTQNKVGTMLDEQQAINIQKQLLVADKVYTQVLGLTPPLKTPRYAQVKFISVEFEKANKVFGVAYDEVLTNKQLGFANCFVAIKLSSKINAPSNLTPAHELFHLYQYSRMMFKHPWLTEGTAEWIGTLFTPLDERKSSVPLPKNKQELLQVMDQKYAASKMWYRLFKLIDNNPQFVVPDNIANEFYSTGEPVVADNKAYGTKFIAVLFDELEKESLAVSKIRGWPAYGWSEKAQRDKTLNPYIWQAIKRAVNKTVPPDEQSEELKQFLAIELEPTA